MFTRKGYKPLWTQLILFGIFIAFGLAIALLSFFLNNYQQTQALRRELSQTAEQQLRQKQALLDGYLAQAQLVLEGAGQCDLMLDYLDDRRIAERRARAESCLQAITTAQASIAQLRYLDEQGMERIRIDRQGQEQAAFPVAEDELQNKAERYYSREVPSTPQDAYWYSALDLNIEHGQVVRPFEPTLRIAKPIHHHGRYRGFLIINLKMQPLLAQLIESHLFEAMLSDHQGQLLVRSDAQTGQLKHLWSGVADTAETLQQHWPDAADSALGQRDFFQNESRFGLALTIEHSSRPPLFLLLQIKPDIVDQLHAEERKYLLLIALTTIFFSLILGMGFSTLLSRLYNRLLETQRALAKQLTLVDRYIPITRTDTEGTIQSANSAYHQLVGYQVEELIGRNHSILRHEDTPDTLYKDLWQTLHAGNEWYGELQDIRKDGSSFWGSLRIMPEFEEHELKGYTAITQDISARKLLEQQALTDPMTGLYNRRHFDEVIERELGRCTREQQTLGLALLDTDCFKQFNDSFGHEAGDRLLIQIAECMRRGLHRATDFSFRIGGDEFAVLFSALNADQANYLLEQIRTCMLQEQIPHPGNGEIGIASVSLGCALMRPTRQSTQLELFKAADEALYQAKNKGRNRVCLTDLSQS